MKSDNVDKQKAVGILKHLLGAVNDDPSANENPTMILDVLYNLSLVLYSLGKYDESRGYCEDLLGIFPDNAQVVTVVMCIGHKL